MSAGRFTLVARSGTRLILPGDARVTSGNGVRLAYRLGRQVESDEWETFGDGRAVPQPMTLEWDLTGISETDAGAKATAMWDVALDIERVERDNRVYRPIAKPLEYDVDSITVELHAVTLTLLPSGPRWLTLTGNAPRAL
ncbi:hypothetical protein [Deinococcus humi]|uniref:Uncharacterized protein n=1 Tax=Deinococcus humi TaxID=662880 RepID=A0A7W8JWS3_9DEIO|nr:hypothetical protein [Deinococcus humi]MBB5363099.1 hypothetical protein [Deinococcus humi]GGO24697.1 hypothetical protein GCM10008949_13870 [Deinococcus humi]